MNRLDAPLCVFSFGIQFFPGLDCDFFSLPQGRPDVVLSRSSALKAVKLNLPSVDRYQEPYDRPQKGTVLVEGVEPKYRGGLYRR